MNISSDSSKYNNIKIILQYKYCEVSSRLTLKALGKFVANNNLILILLFVRDLTFHMNCLLCKQFI